MFAVDLRTSGRPTDASALLTAIDPFGQADRRGMWSEGPTSLAQTILDLSDEHRRRELPTVCVSTGRRIVSWVRLDEREPLIARLDEELRRVRGDADHLPTDPELVLAAHLAWGADAPDHLVGDFSYAIVDPSDESVTVAVDPVAVRPCVVYAERGRVAVATTVAAIQALDGFDLQPSDRWLVDFVAGASSRTETPYAEVTRLDGGEIAVLRAGQDARRHRYHRWRDDPPDARRRDAARVASFRRRLAEAHRDRLRVDGPVGVESSGGLDSSTCVAFAADEIGPERVHAFGFVNLDAEPGLNRAVLDRAGIDDGQRHLIGPSDEHRVMPPDDVIRVLGHPAEHGNGSSHDEFYLRCRDLGARTLLSGFGGDEVATNPGGLLYEELLDRWRLITLARNMHGPRWQRTLRWAKVLTGRNRWRRPTYQLQGLAAATLGRVPLREDVIDRHGLPARLDQQSRYTAPYRRINEWILDERVAAGFVPTRLRDCSLIAQARGVEYSWPLWDRRVVQEYLSAPSIEKRGPGYGRYLHRRAIDGLVADEVTWRETKATGDPLRGDEIPLPPPAPIVFDALHPRLRSLFDPERTRRLNDVARRDDGGRGGASMRARRTVRAVHSLDRWLWSMHPAEAAADHG